MRKEETPQAMPEVYSVPRWAPAALAGGYATTCLGLAGADTPLGSCMLSVLAAGVLLYCSLVDLRFRVVPDGAVAVLAALACAASCIGAPSAGGGVQSLAACLGNGLALAAPVLACAPAFERVRGAGMGGGDVKLLFAIGACVGAMPGAVVLAAACVLAVAWQALAWVGAGLRAATATGPASSAAPPRASDGSCRLCRVPGAGLDGRGADGRKAPAFSAQTMPFAPMLAIATWAMLALQAL